MQSNQAARDGAAPTLLDTLTQLTKAQYLSSAFDKALVTLEQIIVLDSNEPQCQLVKAGILAQMSRSVAEIESCVHAAQVMERQDPILHQHAACIYRLAGALPQALRHADQWVQRSAKQPTQNLLARAMAADLALAILQPSIARQYLRAGISISEMADTDLEVQPEPEGDDLPGLVIPGTGLTVTDYFLSRAELALESGDDHEAIDELVQVMEVVPLSPRLMALQARLAIQRNELQNAQALLSSALDTANAPAEPSFTLLATAASAALELQNWQTASDLWQQAVEKYPLEPRAHLLFARTLVKQAEFQRMCQAMNIVRHAPAANALSENTYQRYERAIKSAKDLIEGWETMPGSLPASQNDKPLPMPALFQDVLGQIERWHKRGEAAFAPSAEAAQALASLPATAEDTAARVACLRQLNELQAAGLAARAYPQDPMVLIQLTLALMNDKPRQALAAIQVAIDNMIKAGRMEPGRAQESTASLTPMVHALTARLLHYNGNRIEDRQAALQAIRMALASWHDEPRWHTLAADIHLTLDNQPDSPDQQAAMIHLKQAIEMEPGNALPYLKIGQIQYADCGYAEALQAFEQAVSLEPDNPTPFIWLARTHLKANDLEQAAAHAERAISLAPDEPEPVLLRGEIALSLNQPRNAQTYAENVLRVYPDHTGALVLLAHALDQMGRPDEALALVEKALAKAGEPLALRLERVRLLQRARGAEPALQAAERLADELADEPQALSLLAEMQERSGRLDEAVRTAQRALRVQSTSLALSSEAQSCTHHLLGRLMHRSGQLDQAVHHLSEAVRLGPEIIEAYLDLGQAYMDRREHIQAMNVYQQALNTAPNDHRPYILIGQALKESKDYVGAETMFRRAAELAPNDLVIHRQLAAIMALNLVHNRRDFSVEGRSRR